jgi:hypothetical protein
MTGTQPPRPAATDPARSGRSPTRSSAAWPACPATCPDEQWRRPSLCTGWTVRDVAAHLTLFQQLGLRDMIAMTARWRGSLDRPPAGPAPTKTPAAPAPGRNPVGPEYGDHSRSSSDRAQQRIHDKLNR